jgi:geranylgeranyl pyrophosphate synthase
MPQSTTPSAHNDNLLERLLMPVTGACGACKGAVKGNGKGEGDVAKALQLTTGSAALRRTADLATSHAQKAADAIGVLPPSAARDGLLRLCADVINRNE